MAYCRNNLGCMHPGRASCLKQMKIYNAYNTYIAKDMLSDRFSLIEYSAIEILFLNSILGITSGRILFIFPTVMQYR